MKKTKVKISYLDGTEETHDSIKEMLEIESRWNMLLMQGIADINQPYESEFNRVLHKYQTELRVHGKCAIGNGLVTKIN